MPIRPISAEERRARLMASKPKTAENTSPIHPAQAINEEAGRDVLDPAFLTIAIAQAAADAARHARKPTTQNHVEEKDVEVEAVADVGQMAGQEVQLPEPSRSAGQRQMMPPPPPPFRPAVPAGAQLHNPTLNPEKPKITSTYRPGMPRPPMPRPNVKPLKTGIKPAIRPAVAVAEPVTQPPENLKPAQGEATSTLEVVVADNLPVQATVSELPEPEVPAVSEQPQPSEHQEEEALEVAEPPTLVGEPIIVADPLVVDEVFPGTPRAAAQSVEAAFTAHKQGAFTVGEDCLTYEDDKETVQVTATRVHVAFMCSEANGKGHGFCLTWLNRNGKECSKVITMPRLVSDWNPLLGELGDEGLFILSPRHLKLFLLETCSRATLPEVRLITEIGFFPLNPDDPDGAYGFMLPSGAILPVDAGLGQVKAGELRYRAPFEHKALGAYQVAGTHEEWKAGVAPAEGNALVVFCTCAVLGSVMLKVYGGENCGFHLYGLSSTGKSTAAQVGMSVLGCAADPQSSSKPTIFGSWSATDNGREIMAACASGAAILMDELDSCPKGASVTVYPIMNGVGKVRMRGTGSMAQQHTWRLLALSTGELSLYERIMREPQREAMLGELSRFLDIPVDNLPRNGALTVEQAQALALQLKKRSGEFYGSACVAFVQWLFAQYPTQGLLRAALLQAIDSAQAELIAHLAPRRHLRPAHKRAIRHFALVLAVGRWAADGILPFSIAAVERAVLVMVEAWCDNFPSLTDEDRVLDGFRAYMRDQRDVVVCTDSATEEEQRGRAPKILLHEGRLYMAPECFQQACGELPVVKVGKILDRLGILHRHGTDGQKVKMTMWPSLFRSQRYYALDANHLLGERELAELMGGAADSVSADHHDEMDLGEIPQI